jgi:hypothetical protein
MSSRDSSTLTQFRQARALYSYNAARSAAVATGVSVRPEQTSGVANAVLVQRVIGGPTQTISQGIVEKGCACASYNVSSAMGYPANQSRE